MISTPKDKKFVTKDDMLEAQTAYANTMPGEKEIDEDNGVVKVSTSDGKIVELRQMSDVEIANTFKTEATRLCFALELSKNGVTLPRLAEKASKGLEAYKVTNQKDPSTGEPIIQPDFVAQHLWFKSIMEIYGAFDNPFNPQGSIPGEKVIDLENMTDEQLEAAIKEKITDSQ